MPPTNPNNPRNPPTRPHVLLLGGHGHVSLLLTPFLLARSWRVTSVIRDAAQEGDVLAAAAEAEAKAAGKTQTLGGGEGIGGGIGTIEVLVESLEEVKSVDDARRILEGVRPDYVVWCAGAGGKGPPTRTTAIDSDAAQFFITAAAGTSSSSSTSVRKFLMISALSARRRKAPWWTATDWASIERVNTQVMPVYIAAKLAADELLTVLGERRRRREEPELEPWKVEPGKQEPGEGDREQEVEERGFRYIILRPGALTHGPATGKVDLGKSKGWGEVSRADVADVAARLLEMPGAGGWYDLVGGGEGVGAAVERVVREGVDSKEGESLEEMERDVGL